MAAGPEQDVYPFDKLLINKTFLQLAEYRMYGITILAWLSDHPLMEIETLEPEDIGMNDEQFIMGMQFIDNSYIAILEQQNVFLQ